MVLQVLIRNFYERFGTFHGIEKTALGEFLETAVSSSGMTKKDFYCSALGYSGKSPAKVMKFRAEIVDKQNIDLDEAKKVLGKPFNSSKEVREFLGISKAVKLPAAIKNATIESAIKLAAMFYSQDVTSVINVNKQLMLFSDWLKSQRKSSVASILGRQEVQSCLLSFSFRENLKEPRIEYKTLIMPEPLDDKSKMFIQKQAIAKVMGKEGLMKHWMQKSAEDIILASDRSRGEYLHLLDYLNATSRTFSQEMEQIGVKVPDLIKAWSMTGSAFFLVGETVFYASDEKNGLHCWHKCDINDFLNYCEDNFDGKPNLVSDCSKTAGDRLHEISCF